MFEHSLYEPEVVAAPPQEGDPFQDYEIRSWDIGPRLYKIFAISAAVNVLALLVATQTSLLTMKGCDSPFVGTVCQALDMVYVGSAVLSSERDYVDVAYDPTHIDDSSDITFVDVSNQSPPLPYPEGYFQLANPDQFQPGMVDAFGNPLTSVDDLAGVPVTPPISGGGSLLDTKPSFPTPNPNVVEGPLPTFNNPGVATTKPIHRPTKPGKPDVDDNAVANVKPTKSPETKPSKSPEPQASPMSAEEVNAVQINKKPLFDLADDVANKWSAQQLDLNQDFTITLNGVITKDGKLDRQKSSFDVAKQKGDQKMIDVGKAAMEALGDSGYLTYLSKLGVDKIVAVLTQDDQQISVRITSATKTPEMAKTVASGLGFAIILGKKAVENPNDPNPSDELILLNGAKVTSEGKNFVLDFAIPKDKAQEMITRKLKESQARKQQQQQPSGNSVTKAPGNTGQ